MTTCRTWSRGFLIKLGFILAVATLLRAYQVGRLSFWYDEVVTMRLARSANPSELIERLGQIDATRSCFKGGSGYSAPRNAPVAHSACSAAC
jgi:hypothetical protein